MNPITIHIGLHKTGSTYLQNTLLPSIPEVKVIRGFQTHRDLMKASLSDTVIISDEGLSGDLWGSYKDFYTFIDKIKKIYNRPKIILGIRSQETFIPSIYKQYLQEKGFKNFDHVFNLRNTGLLKHEDLLLIPKITYLKKNFEQVFIYDQQALLKEEDKFVQELLKFLDINPFYFIQGKTNDSNFSIVSVFQVKMLQKINKVNYLLERAHPSLSLYSKVFRKLHITPRNICQDYLKGIKSKDFEIHPGLQGFIQGYYSSDWEEALKYTRS